MLVFEKKRFDALDSFRGICALMVVCFHARVLLSFTELAFFRSTSLFVEFFFVLSGFVMFHSCGGDLFTSKKFKNYLLARFFRIYPMHLVMLLVVILIEFGKLMAYKRGIVFNNVPFTNNAQPSDILPNLLLLQAWLPQVSSFSFNLVSWSLSVELYLYVLFGLILLLSSKRRLLIFAFLVVIGVTFMLAGTSFLKSGALRGLYCFFGGCLSYVAYSWLNNTVKKGYVIFTIIELMLLTSVVIVLSYQIDGRAVLYKGFTATLLFCLTVITMAMEAGAISGLLRGKIFTYLGKLSYSIYITHYVLWSIVIAGVLVFTKFSGISLSEVRTMKGESERFITTHNTWLDICITIMFLFIVIGVSSLTFRFVEMKGIALGKRIRGTAGGATARLERVTKEVVTQAGTR